VDNHILSLRAKLESDPAHPQRLITVHGVGYKLTLT
jgi:DNA-binding response OmpR family regulator